MMPQEKPEALGPRMVTGFGQSDTHALKITRRDTGEEVANPHPSAGKDYQTITGRDIAALVESPSSEDKQRAPWFIGSSYVDHDARSHEAQKENGTFHVLPVDIDKGAVPLSKVESATKSIVGEQTSFIIYSSSSATKENPKWRVLFFVGGDGLPGAEYHDTQNALFDLYKRHDIECDRALTRTGQLIFLPNVPADRREPNGEPKFYDYILRRGSTLKLDDKNPIIARRQHTRQIVAKAAQEATQRRSRAVSVPQDDDSPVDHYCAANALSDVLAGYGYQQQGSSPHWKSPNSTTGSYAVRVYEDRAWVSLSGSDQAAGIGSQKEHCCFGDAFDLYVHYEHQGDYKAAVRAYGREIRPSAVVVPLRADQESHDLSEDFGPAEEESDVVAPAPKTPPPGMALDQWAFLSGDNEFWHAPTGRRMTLTAFNLAMSPYTPFVEFTKPDGEVVEKKLSASKTLINHLDGVVAHTTMYRPDASENDLETFDVEGVPYVNSYQPQSVPEAVSDWQGHDAWRRCQKHILDILGEATGWLVIKWMAHNVQHPGKKILWALIIVGVQGDGKTTLSKMLGAAMGFQNVSPVSPEAMFSEFTAWAEGACVKVLEEIRVHGNSRHNAMNKLKPLITNDQVEVVRKGKDGKQVVNVTNYLALTNHMDALALDEGDRRWGVFKTRFENRAEMLTQFDAEYWAALHDGIDQHPGVIRSWLLSIDLTDFNRVAGPEIGEHKRAMIDATKPADQMDVEEAIACGWHGVTESLLATDCLNSAILNQTGQRLSTSRLSNALMQLGWVKIPGTLKWSGTNRRLWFKKSAMLGGASPSKLRAILDTSDTNGGL
jgi:hypothetical protein